MRRAIKEYKETMLANGLEHPKTTLQRCISGKVAGSDYSLERQQHLPEESEKELPSLMKLIYERGLPLTKRHIQGIAFNDARTNNTKGFSERKDTAEYNVFFFCFF